MIRVLFGSLKSCSAKADFGLNRSSVCWAYLCLSWGGSRGAEREVKKKRKRSGKGKRNEKRMAVQLFFRSRREENIYEIDRVCVSLII